jgi:hypothetical protein
VWHNVEQNTEEWFSLRLGKITSSNFDKIMVNYGKVDKEGKIKWGQGAIDYAERIALEIVTNERDESSSFKNGYMERGHELEPLAIDNYEESKFKIVDDGGFYESDCGRFGDSPDGLVGENGCIEIKSVIPKTQWKRIKTGELDSSYKWQILGHLLIGKKEWCDFISYCPEMPENKRLIVFRVERDEEELTKLKTRLDEFHGFIMEHVETLKEK